MTLLPLTRGKFAMIDDDQLQRCNQYNWYYMGNGYAATDVDGQPIYLHHFIYGAKIQLDHRDRNPLNCQKDNLRSATHSQNAANQNKRKGSSRFKGLSLCPKTFRWRVMCGGKYHGLYDDEIEAAKIYNKAAIERYGEYAKINIT